MLDYVIPRRLIALRMFYDYLAYVCEAQISNPVVPQRHYVVPGHRLPRDIRQEEVEKLFRAIGDHLRDRTVFTLMLHSGLWMGEVVNLRLGDVFLSENRFQRVAGYQIARQLLKFGNRFLKSSLPLLLMFFDLHSNCQLNLKGKTDARSEEPQPSIIEPRRNFQCQKQIRLSHASLSA